MTNCQFVARKVFRYNLGVLKPCNRSFAWVKSFFSLWCAREMVYPQQLYERDLSRDNFESDARQAVAVEKLDELYSRLIKDCRVPSHGYIKRMSSFFLKGQPKWVVKGIYFWGGVGRGKTYLMDCFFDCLPFKEKKRLHFSRFMKLVHTELDNLKNQKNPLEIVAEKLSSQARVLCLDEFHVDDIADAMILKGLLISLFDKGVCLVTTSNIAPDNLYQNGLQRQQFLGAIEQIKRNCDVFNLDGGMDYRFRALQRADLYYFPLNETAEAALEATFVKLSNPNSVVQTNIELQVENRAVKAMKIAGEIVWFEFRDLCEGPRSQNDYIQIAKEFKSVIISSIPILGANNDNAARRFIHLVDEFYDRNVKLVVSAETSIEKLYSGVRLGTEFQRTVSRLIEMQSEEFLARPHEP